MSTLIQPFAARSRFVTQDGLLTDAAVRWFQYALLVRVGGTDALSNLELAEEIAALSAETSALEAQVAALEARVNTLESEMQEALFEEVFQPAQVPEVFEMVYQ